ncbi:Citrate Succinate antiporter (TC 2.A.47.3.2) [uncultured Candidatus Thioglobus sp.]|nr:Citrate Succinate antiporter (TC 2.A.47.3.2) [uncultured Candidatus Thioglobus sp.]SMM99490.1 Citrate Succinate antiporter (TC 2.A.47.3.2) [uncultured Candidatus Thioglobus sp.]
MSILKEISAKNILFAKFSNLELSKLYRATEYQTFKSGETVFSHNQKITHYYLIKSGEVVVTNESGNNKTLGQNSSFGDESLLRLKLGLCSVTAKTDCELLVIDADLIINLKSFEVAQDVISDNLLFNLSKKNKIVTQEQTSPKQHNYLFSLLAWLLTIIAPLLIVYFLSGLDYPPNQEQILLIYIFLSAIFMWIFRLVPEFVPALYLLLSMVLLSLAPVHIALSGFYANAFFLVISLSILGLIIGLSNSSYRLLLYLLKFNVNSKLWLHFVLFISGLFLTPIIPSTNGRVSILYNLFNEAMSLCKIPKGSLEYQRLIASTIGGISLMSPIFLTSKTINLVVLGMLSSQDQFSFQFYYWFLSASLVGLILLAFYALLTWLLFSNNHTNNIDIHSLKEQAQILGKITVTEVLAIGSILIFIILVFTSNIHNMPISWLAILLAFSLFALGALKRENFNNAIDWDFLIFLAGLLSFTNVMTYLEIDIWISHYMGWLSAIISYNFIGFVAILAIVIFLFRLIMPINIVVVLLAGILVPVATNSSVSPWLVIFITLLFAENYTYNFTTSYMLNFFNAIKDNAFYSRILTLQILLYLVKFVAIIISIPFWVSLGILSL